MQKRNIEPERLRKIGYMSLLHIAYAGYFILDGATAAVRHAKTIELQPFFVAVAVIMGVFGVTMSKASFVKSRLIIERIGPDPNSFTVQVFFILTVILTVDMVVLGCFYALTVPGAELVGHIVPYADRGTLYLVKVPGASAFYLGFTIAAAAINAVVVVFASGIALINFNKS
jgi:hypothetical protein